MLLPKIGTLEAVALAAMLESKDNTISCESFAEGHSLNNPDTLNQVMNNLRNGMYESDEDCSLKFDA